MDSKALEREEGIRNREIKALVGKAIIIEGLAEMTNMSEEGKKGMYDIAYELRRQALKENHRPLKVNGEQYHLPCYFRVPMFS